MKKSKKYLVVIAGPTASGKTDLAIRVARAFSTEIISADSRQFFKEIPIGTAAPTSEQLAQVKHHFVGHLSVNEPYNVSKFESDVLKLLNSLFSELDVVVMTGGSGLYIDAVCKGIDTLPDPDPAIRKELNQKLEQEGLTALQQQLKELDPDYYDQVDLNNSKRLLRALEVCLQTGQTFSSQRLNQPKPRDFSVIKIGLNLDRQELYARINNRTDQMLGAGWVEEARSVLPFREVNALNTVGYKEIFKFLDGEWSLDLATEKIKTNTRRYAKRQMTWFTKDPEMHWFPAGDFEGVMAYLEKEIVD